MEAPLIELPVHVASWRAGWLLVLCGFASGALIGLRFHDERFWGGYDSFRRRLVRLGHIAFVALGFANLLYALSPWPEPGTTAASIAGATLIFGAFAMPTVCFLTAWRRAFRHVFAVPVAALSTAVVTVLIWMPS